MRALVIGYGSIGQRHARLLRDLGCPTAVVTRRTVEFPNVYPNLETALAEWQPEYVVVASRTAEHIGDLSRLIGTGFSGRLLVEKPLFERSHALPAHSFSHVAVAYNLRFHPLLVQLRDFLLTQDSLLVAQATVGQYLPGWRPASDYRQSYSAKRHEGGGVLRDLSHELDYTHWLFGPWIRLAAVGGHFSPLEIDSDDAFSLMMVTSRCPLVSVHLNYLDRTPRREIVVQTSHHTARVDLIRGIFEVDGVLHTSVQPDRDFTYLAQHRAMLSGDTASACSLADGMEVMTLIDAAEAAASNFEWIHR